jgi:hypothetical protein
MEAGIALFVVRDAVDFLETKNLLKIDGKFGTFTPQEDAELALVIQNSLEAHGYDVPDKIENVIKMLPLVLALAGVK